MAHHQMACHTRNERLMGIGMTAYATLARAAKPIDLGMVAKRAFCDAALVNRYP